MQAESTKELILDSAQALAQSRGFNAFSYADIANDVGIRKASIHYHFASKEELEAALLERYRKGFMDQLKSLSVKNSDATKLLKKYGDLYAATLSKRVICLGGMMASDIGALPERLVPSLQGFFTEQAEWLADVLAQGKASGEFTFSGSPRNRAALFLAALQGGLLMGNAMGDDDVFKRIRQDLINGLKA